MTANNATAHGLVSKGPARRRAITRAATRVLRASGIEGLTHRAVAEEAGVPLGSTTYYFTSRDDLINAAIEHATDTTVRWLQEWAAANADRDVAVILSRLLHDYVTKHRSVAILDIEIYVLAARRPELRVHTSRWTAAFVDLLTEFVAPDVAADLAATFNGLLLRAVSSDLGTPLEELNATFARIMRNG